MKECEDMEDCKNIKECENVRDKNLRTNSGALE